MPGGAGGGGGPVSWDAVRSARLSYQVVFGRHPVARHAVGLVHSVDSDVVREK